MMSIINEEDWKSIAEMIGVEIGVPFKVEIPEYFKEYMKRAMEDFDIENIEYCIYANGFACYDTCRSVFFGHDNDFLHASVLGGILNHDIKVLRCRFRPTKGTIYYYVDSSSGDIYSVTSQEAHSDYMNFMAGNCFKTHEEALDNKHKFLDGVQDEFNRLYE
ncbi:MAG: hypothetical protein U0L26_02690 [Cellulosilyticum sp.]|nr:hypothetical protein [Cellulosilyticum sp.]